MIAYMHMGFPKSGSSTIQTTFYKNRRRLEEAGFAYARFTEFGREMRSHSPAFLDVYSNRSQEVRRTLNARRRGKDVPAQFDRELRQNLASTKPLIFSGEDICYLNAAEMQRMKDDFAAAGWTIRPLLLVRSPLDFLNSLASTIVRQGAVDLLPRGKLANHLSRRITAVRSVFPNAEFYPFDLAKDHPSGPAGFVADKIQPGLSRILIPHRENVRLSRNAVALMRHLNVVVPLRVHVPEPRVSPLRVAGDTMPLSRVSGERFSLSTADIEPVRGQIAAETAWLGAELGAEFCNDPVLGAPEDVAWTEAHVPEVRRALRALPRHLKFAAASYFAGRADCPSELRALAERYCERGSIAARFRHGAFGGGMVERLYRKLRGEW